MPKTYRDIYIITFAYSRKKALQNIKSKTSLRQKDKSVILWWKRQQPYPSNNITVLKYYLHPFWLSSNPNWAWSKQPYLISKLFMIYFVVKIQNCEIAVLSIMPNMTGIKTAKQLCFLKKILASWVIPKIIFLVFQFPILFDCNLNQFHHTLHFWHQLFLFSILTPHNLSLGSAWMD